jgi:hypothetical protein
VVRTGKSAGEAKLGVSVLRIENRLSACRICQRFDSIACPTPLGTGGTPPTFGAVGSGSRLASFFVSRAQGGRGRGRNTTTFQRDRRDEEGDNGVWMSVWVGGRRGRDAQALRRHRADGLLGGS